VGELKRWILVIIMGVVVAALSFRTFFAVYLFLPLGLLLAAAVLRAIGRFVRGLDTKNPADITEAYRSVVRALAWLALCGAVVVGHEAQTREVKLSVEQFSMRMDQRKTGDGFPAAVSDVPPHCSYQLPVKERFTVVCTFTPPFEKGTYTSSTKRWDDDDAKQQ
jgi:hypothetical protein